MQTFTDPAFEALYTGEKYADLERAATLRVAAQADDAQAVLAIALNALRAEDAKRRNAAIGHAEVCLQRQPQAAACHCALGVVLGVQAVSEGMLKLMGSVGRIRSALAEALALQPTWFSARSAMVEFYLQAPGVVGGSESKALETARAAKTPQQVRALEARIALHDKKYERVLQTLGDIKTGEDRALDEDVRAWPMLATMRRL